MGHVFWDQYPEHLESQFNKLGAKVAREKSTSFIRCGWQKFIFKTHVINTSRFLVRHDIYYIWG